MKSTGSNFWDKASELDFHQNVVQLYNWNREPSEAENYRAQVVLESNDYVPAYGEEQHIASDHIAFLAQIEEGAKTVSAALVEEHKSGSQLVIRLAANHTPTTYVLDGLKDILSVIEMCARTGPFQASDKNFLQLIHLRD